MPSIFPIAWTFRWAFLTALLVPFSIACVVIIRQPETYIVRSAIRLATAFTQGRPQTIDPPDQIAKAAVEQYLPLALTKVQGVASPDFRADAVGSSIMLTGSTPLASEDGVKEIQQRVLDSILKQQKEQADAIRGNLVVDVKSAKNRINNYDKIIDALNQRKEEFKSQIAKQRGLIDDIQSGLANTIKTILPDSKIQDVITGEAKVREFRERLHSEETFSRDINFAQANLDSEMGKIVNQRDEQYLKESQTEFQLNSVQDAQVLAQPTRALTAKGSKRPLLLLAALVGSFIFAVFIVLMLDRISPDSSRQTQ